MPFPGLREPPTFLGVRLVRRSLLVSKFRTFGSGPVPLRRQSLLAVFQFAFRHTETGSICDGDRLAEPVLPTLTRVMLARPSLWRANSGLSGLDWWLCGASLCPPFSNFRFGMPETPAIRRCRAGSSISSVMVVAALRREVLSPPGITLACPIPVGLPQVVGRQLLRRGKFQCSLRCL